MASVAQTRRATGWRTALLAEIRRHELIAIGGFALAVRIAWVAVYGRTVPAPFDTLFYEAAAHQLATGHGFADLFGQATAHWPPGFPFLVSLLYRVFGDHAWLGLALNVVLATATTVLLYLIGARMFGKQGARIASLSFAILPGPLFMTAVFMTETTYTSCRSASLRL